MGAPAAAQTLEEQLLAESPAALAEDARKSGDPVRGAGVFYARTLACSTCHSVGDQTNTIGPDLTEGEPPLSDAALIEAILQPSKTIAAAYATTKFLTADGRLLTGVPVEENDEQLVLRDAAAPDKLITLQKNEIEERLAAQQSLMPDGQVNQLADRGQFLDLVRYLMEIRAGGIERARQLQPAPDPLAMKVPDDPLPWQPVVQRGDVVVEGNAQFPHAVALGFAGGTVLFDANRLQVVGLWFDGFVKNTPQNYFGLNWHQNGKSAETLADSAPPLRFKLSDQADWQDFEPTTTSDPNLGTRFDGYQIGKVSVRLHYRVYVGGQRISVTEDLRAESRPEWRGFARQFTLTGMPTGAQVALTLPPGSSPQVDNAAGQPVAPTNEVNQAPLVSFQAGGGARVVTAHATAGVQWRPGDDQTPTQLIAHATQAETPVVLRVDTWHYRGSQPAPTPAELAALAAQPPRLDDVFDRPQAPSSPLPETPQVNPAEAMAKRPAVQPQENIDEFPNVRGRFVRFVVNRTNDGAEPGLDELEVYGADPKRNLALEGKASASSALAGYPIHQIPHLNDGVLGNERSWISAERGKGWAQIEFPQPIDIQRIVWARDRTGKCQDRLATAYQIEVSPDGQNWTSISDERGRQAAIPAPTVRRDAAPGYVMETIPPPFPTWRPSDIAFGDDGVMYAIAMTEGQIWRARTPPAGHPEQVEWRRYATGLYHPTGLAIVDGRLFVAQKPEITELIDRDGDGVVDHYRTVATGWGLSSGWHEYCFGLAVDPQKNLWFALNTGNFWTHPGLVSLGRWRGSILRVAHDTEKLEEVATGCRVPNGVTQGPDGKIFFVDNQGDWIQVCKLAHIVPGRFYGHPETKADALAAGQFPEGRSTIWLPYDRCRSAAGPVYDATRGGFGPFADQMFVGDVGYGANPGILRVALEKVKDEYQGACFQFVSGQPQGCQHMKFGADHQLYMTSLTTGLTRMAYTGKMPFAMKSISVRPRGAGFVVKLTEPLAENVQLTPEQFAVQSYHYLYTANYGSPKADEKRVPVEQVQLSPDRTEITLTLSVETHPLGKVYEFQLNNLTSAEGEPLVHNQAWYTVHAVPTE